jgi:hypothetical protein
MAEAFDYSRDSYRVQWLGTIRFNLARAFVGGIAVATVAAIAARDAKLLTIIIAAPLGWLFLCLPGWHIMRKLPRNAAGIVALIFVWPFFLIAMAGDPFLFLISRLKPEWLPVQDTLLINFCPIFFVLKPNPLQ